MSDVILETIRAILVGVIFSAIVFRNINKDDQKHKGWSFITCGFALIFFGMLIDITDNFPELNRFIIIGDTSYQAFIEKVVGYLLGFSLLAVGFWKWLPSIAEVEGSKKKLEASHNILLTVLDSLDAIVYVADIQTYELLFLNKFARNIFGDNSVGKTCWQTLQQNQDGPCKFCSNSELVTIDGKIKGMYSWEFQNTVNGHWYDIRDRAIKWPDGRIVRLEIATDVTEKKNADKVREELITKLEKAIDEVKSLRGIIPICSHCKNIRDDKGFWSQVEVYFSRHSAADFSHSICPECAKKHYPEFLNKS